MYSPIGCSRHSAQFCSVRIKISLRDSGGITRRLAWQLYNKDLYRHKDDNHDINVICEPMAMKHGDMELICLVIQFWMLLLSFDVLSNFLFFYVFLTVS